MTRPLTIEQVLSVQFITEDELDRMPEKDRNIIRNSHNWEWSYAFFGYLNKQHPSNSSEQEDNSAGTDA